MSILTHAFPTAVVALCCISSSQSVSFNQFGNKFHCKCFLRRLCCRTISVSCAKTFLGIKIYRDAGNGWQTFILNDLFPWSMVGKIELVLCKFLIFVFTFRTWNKYVPFASVESHLGSCVGISSLLFLWIGLLIIFVTTNLTSSEKLQ